MRLVHHFARRTYPASTFFAIALIAASSTNVIAQSGTKARPPASTTSRSGSTTKNAESTVAMSGYCPVCVIEMKKWVKGDPRFSVVQNGKTYLFPGQEQKDMFLKSPEKYTPALGGDCTVCLVDMGKRITGSVQHAVMHENRLFLFPSDDQKKTFQANPAKYASIDLAAGGKCTVCKVEMNQDVDGKPELGVLYKGLRYLFPGKDQRDMFLSNPSKYEVEAPLVK